MFRKWAKAHLKYWLDWARKGSRSTWGFFCLKEKSSCRPTWWNHRNKKNIFKERTSIDCPTFVSSFWPIFLKMSTNASWSDFVNLESTKFKSGLPNFESSDLYLRSGTWASFSSRLKPLRCCESRCCCSKNSLAHRRRRRSSTISW